jgi:hypothetical protein
MTPEEPELKNGLEPKPATEQKQDPELETMAVPESKPAPEPEPATIHVRSADPEAEEPNETEIQSNESEKLESNEQNASRPAELQQNRTFTMRELLTELKTEEGDDAASTPLRFGSVSTINTFHCQTFQFFRFHAIHVIIEIRSDQIRLDCVLF